MPGAEGEEDVDRLLSDGSGGWSEQVKALTGDVRGAAQPPSGDRM